MSKTPFDCDYGERLAEFEGGYITPYSESYIRLFISSNK